MSLKAFAKYFFTYLIKTGNKDTNGAEKSKGWFNLPWEYKKLTWTVGKMGCLKCTVPHSWKNIQISHSWNYIKQSLSKCILCNLLQAYYLKEQLIRQKIWRPCNQLVQDGSGLCSITFFFFEANPEEKGQRKLDTQLASPQPQGSVLISKVPSLVMWVIFLFFFS